MFRLSAVSLLLAAAGAAIASGFLIDSPATYLRANGEVPYSTIPYNLAANGYLPGQTVVLTRLGQYNYNASPALAYGLSGVFSSSNVLLPETFLNRIPGAIAAGSGWVSPNTAVGNLSTDIPEDFQICNFGGTANGITLTIPAGAQYLFASVEDDFFSDNNNHPEVYLAIAPVPEPTSLAALALGAAVLRRRRNSVS